MSLASSARPYTERSFGRNYTLSCPFLEIDRQENFVSQPSVGLGEVMRTIVAFIPVALFSMTILSGLGSREGRPFCKQPYIEMRDFIGLCS